MYVGQSSGDMKIAAVINSQMWVIMQIKAVYVELYAHSVAISSISRFLSLREEAYRDKIKWTIVMSYDKMRILIALLITIPLAAAAPAQATPNGEVELAGLASLSETIQVELVKAVVAAIKQQIPQGRKVALHICITYLRVLLRQGRAAKYLLIVTWRKNQILCS